MKFLGRLPQWLQVTLALISAGALYAIAQISGSMHGWHLALTIVLGVAFTGLAVGVPQLTQWQSQQESKLKVELETDPEDLAIPTWTDGQGVIDSMVAAEEAACLASVAQAIEPPRITTSKPKSGQSGFVAEEMGDLSLKDYEELLAKKDSGGQLTPEEEQALAETAEAIKEIAPALSAVFSFANTLIRPDSRTPEEYRNESERYLSYYSEFLSEQLRREYVVRDIGLLRLILRNPTERVFEDIQVEDSISQGRSKR